MNTDLKLSDKKRKRNESRKRKIQAFLDIAKSNDEDRKRRYQNSTTVDQTVSQFRSKGPSLQIFKSHETSGFQTDAEYKALKAAFKERKKAKEKKPLFYLVGPGTTAQYPLQDLNSKLALYVQDIQHLLLLVTMGQSFSYGTRWCRMIRYQKVSHVVFLTIEGISLPHLQSQELAESKTLFKENIVEFISPSCYCSSFLAELVHVPISLTMTKRFVNCSFACNAETILKPLKSMFSISKSKGGKKSEEMPDTFPRTHLLLSLPQLLTQGFPMPCNGHPDTKNYCFTKKAYKEVTDTSPLFAIDCEMCITSEGMHELTRISLMDEKLDVLYDTLVKPRNRITNYVTRYSGITESMLVDVSVRLEDVQKAICELLPEDAILCGQSLNFDLHALKMMHPYVIDTSVIYNITGFRSRKSSLKCLSSVFLNKEIQCGNKGHDSVEDGVATMELVKLKLSRGLGFGDVLLGGEVPPPSDQSDNTNSFSPNSDNCLLHNIMESGKSVCVVGPREKVLEYVIGTVGTSVKEICSSSHSEIIQRTIENAIEHDVTFVHVLLKKETEKNLSVADSAIRSIYDACADRALFIVASVSPSGNGVCMVKVKDLTPHTVGPIQIHQTVDGEEICCIQNIVASSLELNTQF